MKDMFCDDKPAELKKSNSKLFTKDEKCVVCLETLMQCMEKDVVKFECNDYYHAQCAKTYITD